MARVTRSDLPAVRRAGEAARPALSSAWSSLRAGWPVGKGWTSSESRCSTDNRIAQTRRLSRARRGVSRAWSSRAAFATSSGTATIDGPCDVTTHSRTGMSISPTHRCLDECDVFIRDERALSILQEGRRVKTGSSRCLRAIRHLVDTAIRLATNFNGWSEKDGAGDVAALAHQRGKRTVGYRTRDRYRRTLSCIDKWKVFVPRRSWRRQRDTYPHRILSTADSSLSPASVCTQTYLVVGRFDSESEAESVLSLPTVLACSVSSCLLHKIYAARIALGLLVRADCRRGPGHGPTRPLREIRHHARRDRVHRDSDDPCRWASGR